MEYIGHNGDRLFFSAGDPGFSEVQAARVMPALACRSVWVKGHLINVNSDGSVTISSGCSGQLCVSTNGPSHATYYLTNRRQDGSIVVFEVDAALHKQIMDSAVPQRQIPGVPRDPNAPKIVDSTKGQPSVSLELPKVWDRLIEQNSSKACVLTKEEFLNEFGK